MKVNTKLVTMSAGSFQRKETINQIIPPIAKSNGPAGYSSGNPALTNVPIINTAVASHFNVLPAVTFSMPIMSFLLLLFCSL